MSPTPELSVVMSVYNARDHLAESIESILNQSYTDFEFIIINDGSTDDSGKIIEKYAAKDQRIITIRHRNMGLTKSLNIGINKAQGKYIARQDADDTSFPQRLEKQMAFLKKHRDIVLCGTWFIETNEDGGSMIRYYPTEDKILRKDLKYLNNFCHPSTIFLKEAFLAAGGYDENFKISQDFELWIRLAEMGRISNIPETLVNKRIGFSQTISWQNRAQKRFIVCKMISKHFVSWRDINYFKFCRHYTPRFVYGMIPVPILRMLRRLRYKH